MGQSPLRNEAGKSGEQAQVQHDCGRLGPGGRFGFGVAGRAGLQRQMFLLSGQPAPRALHRRARRHQRGQELSERRRQHLPAVLRHREGRRFPRPRGRTCTAWRRSASTSSTNAWRRACRSRANTAARWPTARSAARRCRARSTRADRRGSSCCWAPIRRWNGRSASGKVKMLPRTEMLGLVVIDGRARGIVTRDLITGKIESHVADAVGAGYRRLRQRLLSFDQRQGIELHRHLARAQTRRGVCESVFHADSPDLHSGFGRVSIQTHA